MTNLSIALRRVSLCGGMVFGIACGGSVLALARQCDPTKSGNCIGDYADGCGCEVPYDIAGAYGKAVSCAFDAWTGASCFVMPDACGPTTCVTPTSAGATCVPDASGTSGTCQWKQ